MRQLLLDVGIVVDLCVERAGSANSRRAVTSAQAADHGLWLYVGAVPLLQRLVASELAQRAVQRGEAMPERETQAQARRLLEVVTARYQWLAALAGEGPVFAAEDPQSEQWLRALDRFPSGTAALVTREPSLLACHPERTLTPEALIDALGAETAKQPKLDFIDLRRQQRAIRAGLEHNIHRVLHHGQYILGPEVRELEARLATYVGTQHCITVASGTDALLIGLMALGIGPGDEVITTPFTFVATIEVITLLGATPVFIDIEPETANMDATRVEAKITAKTKAILPVSLYGQPADMDAINAIAARHDNIPVIEDAAQSLGAVYRGRRSGNLCTIGCTSFFPSKPLGGYGDGGAIFTSDDLLAQACREIRIHGQSERYLHGRLGINGRMDSLQCAVVLAKLERFPSEITQRQAVARRYHALLGVKSEGTSGTPNGEERTTAPAIKGITPLPWPKADRDSVFAQYTVLAEDRGRLQTRLHAAGIPTAVHYPTLISEQPAYANLADPSETPVALAIARQVMSLPMHPDLGEGEQRRIVAAMGES